LERRENTGPEYAKSKFAHKVLFYREATAAEEILNITIRLEMCGGMGIYPAWGYFLAINGQNVDIDRAVSNWVYTFDDSAWPALQYSAGNQKGLSDGFWLYS